MRRSATKEKILLATMNYMAVHGFKGTTTKCIAREAGVNEVTIFKHFRNKDTLIHELLETMTIRIREEIDEFFHSRNDNIEDLLRAKFTFINEIYEKYKPYFLITIREIGSKELEFIKPSIFEYLTQEMEKELLTIASPEISEEEVRALAITINSVMMVLVMEIIKHKVYNEPTILEMNTETMIHMLLRLWKY